MYRLDIIDDRDDKTREEQIKAFKENLIQEIEYGGHIDTKLEDSLVTWINLNRVNQSILIGEHKREIGYPVNIKDRDIHAVPEISKQDLFEHSKKHKHLVFKLSYMPENPYESWVKYYKGGKVQHCGTKIVVDDFDEKKLREPK